MYIANKTLAVIDDHMKADQGASFRVWLGKVLPHISDAYSQKNDPYRSHLGASIIGGECARKIWYSFHWSKKSEFEGRMLRLFNRGHLEEGRFIALLLMIGCQVYQQTEDGKQYRISDYCGHFGGSTDAIIVGLPDLPEGTPCLGEFKTHNEKSFKELKEKGVREAKFEHYIQMQIYMFKLGLSVALYLAVNKNTDEIYAEFVMLNSELAQQYIYRAGKIIWIKQPPNKLNNSIGFYKCRFCDYKTICHSHSGPDINCRTCQQSKPNENGEWDCALKNCELDENAQLKACTMYATSLEYK